MEAKSCFTGEQLSEVWKLRTECCDNLDNWFYRSRYHRACVKRYKREKELVTRVNKLDLSLSNCHCESTRTLLYNKRSRLCQQLGDINYRINFLHDRVQEIFQLQPNQVAIMAKINGVELPSIDDNTCKLPWGSIMTYLDVLLFIYIKNNIFTIF